MSPGARPSSADEQQRNRAFLRGIGEVVRRHRKDRGLTQLQVAVACDIQPSYLSAIELGQKTPTVTTLWRVSVHVGADLSDIIKEAGY